MHMGMEYDRKVSTHSRPKAAGILITLKHKRTVVSTHSRPKAAGTTTALIGGTSCSFNTQPPEGGWTRLDNADTY